LEDFSLDFFVGGTAFDFEFDFFERDQSVISMYLSIVFKDGELDKESNMQKMHFAKSDKPIVFYSLDVIISVGYRVKSIRGTQFR
jgi:hypothetical protein